MPQRQIKNFLIDLVCQEFVSDSNTLTAASRTNFWCVQHWFYWEKDLQRCCQSVLEVVNKSCQNDNLQQKTNSAEMSTLRLILITNFNKLFDNKLRFDGITWPWYFQMKESFRIFFWGGSCFGTPLSQMGGGRAVCQPEQGQVLQGCSSQSREPGLSSPVTTANPLLLPLSAPRPQETGKVCKVKAGVTL